VQAGSATLPRSLMPLALEPSLRDSGRPGWHSRQTRLTGHRSFDRRRCHDRTIACRDKRGEKNQHKMIPRARHSEARAYAYEQSADLTAIVARLACLHSSVWTLVTMRKYLNKSASVHKQGARPGRRLDGLAWKEPGRTRAARPSLAWTTKPGRTRAEPGRFSGHRS
jgi:hypothetical protein